MYRWQNEWTHNLNPLFALQNLLDYSPALDQPRAIFMITGDFLASAPKKLKPYFFFFSLIFVTGIVTSPSAVFGSLAKLVEGCTPGCLSACLVQRSEWGEVGGRNNW